MESTPALNVLQKLGHCFTITVFSVVLQGVTDSERFIFIDIGAYGQQSDGTFSASALYHLLKGSESTLPNLASFREVEQKCLSSSLVMRPLL